MRFILVMIILFSLHSLKLYRLFEVTGNSEEVIGADIYYYTRFNPPPRCGAPFTPGGLFMLEVRNNRE